jgi:hypothetical protein
MLMGGYNPQSTLEALEALSRIRPLTEIEVRRLERALDQAHRNGRGSSVYTRWSKADDYRLIRYLIGGKKPALIAGLMNRSEWAIWRRLNRLGINVRKIEAVRPANCSIASAAGK